MAEHLTNVAPHDDPTKNKKGRNDGKESLLKIIGKLAVDGERAGFSVGEITQLLDGGLSVKTLLQLIARRLEVEGLAEQAIPASSSRWIM